METVIAASFRCARCGVESSERACFVIPEKHGKPPREIRCVLCEQLRHTGSAMGLELLLGTMATPLIAYVITYRSFDGLTLPVLLLSLLIVPISVIAHELGHAVAAHLVGFEIGAIVIGRGRKLLAFEVRGVPVRLYGWPIAGFVFVGDPPPRFVRSRLWLIYLMGPMANALLALACIAFWPELVEIVGTPLVFLFAGVNLLLAVFNLIPYRITELGRSVANDGLSLLKIPGYGDEDLAPLKYVVPWMRAMAKFEDGDYEAARAETLRALERAPTDPHLLVLLSACHSFLHEHVATAAVLKPLIDSPTVTDPLMNAVIRNNVAFALLLSPAGSLEEADKLSDAAFSRFPCLLMIRSTRSLVLAATGRAAQALELLEYGHFDTADRKTRGHREAARAFAYRKLGREAEAVAARECAQTLDPWNAELLENLSLSAQ